MKWISMADKFPAEGQSCLVYVVDDNTKDGGERREYQDVWDYHANHAYWHGTKVNGVTHWMPLPEPPK